MTIEHSMDVRLSIKQVAEKVGRSPSSIQRDYNDGKFPKPEQFREGGRRYWRMSVIQPYIAPLYPSKGDL